MPVQKKHTANVKSSYLHSALEPQRVKKFVAAAAKLLRPMSFEAIAFRGMSGALVAPILAYSLQKSLIMVRKPEDFHSSHSSSRVEGDINAGNYLIVDDQVATGRTVRTILEDVEVFAPEAKCIGILLYNNFLQYGDELKLMSPERCGYTPQIQIPESTKQCAQRENCS